MNWREFGKEDTRAVSEMETFVSDHPKGHFMQCPRWAEVKRFWGWRGILLYEEERIVGAMSVLIRPLPLGFSMFYAPRGPVCDREDPAVWEALMEALRHMSKEHRAVLLYLDPDETDDSREFRILMERLGFREKADAGFGNIQPQYVFRLALTAGETEIFRSFSPKTRYNIGLAERKGVTVREYSGSERIPEDVLESFSALMKITGARDRFQVRDRDYFAGLMKALQGDALLCMAYFDGKPIAGTVEIFCGKKAWYLYGASANEYRGAMPNYLLQWTMIRRALERGCGLYDFRGVPGDLTESNPLYGLYRFKKGFSGTYTKFTGLFTYTFRPVSGFLLKKLMELRRNLRARLSGK